MSKKIDLKNDSLELATLGGGCFWCTEAIYERTKGIVAVESGYSGGDVENPTYEQVCSKIQDTPKLFAFNTIQMKFRMPKFWIYFGEPTTQQRSIVKEMTWPQYRSVIFYHNEEQKQIAEQSLKDADAAKIWEDPIVTVVEELKNYYKAENYHQNYYNQNKNKNTYCTFVVKPKVEKFEKLFKDRLKDKAKS